MSRPQHLCFCKFCKGKTQLTRHKINQHVKIYGLFGEEGSSTAQEGPSEKKSRVCFEDSDNESESDKELEQAPTEGQNEQALTVGVLLEETDDHDDFPTGYDSDAAIETQLSNVQSNTMQLEVLECL